jgi:hypothetical protein
MILTCPICNREDAVRCKDEPRFVQDGRLTAICFHGHGNGRPVTFDAETGALIKHEALEPHQALYRLLEASEARGFGAAFLAHKCGVYRVTVDAIQRASVPFPTEQQVRAVDADGCAWMAMPLYDGAAMVGLELRVVEVTASKATRQTKTLGATGVYIANPGIQPKAVICLEGTWDAVSAAWDAYSHDSEHYAFTSIKAGTSAELVRRTHEAHFPGVPVLIITDQDASGKAARSRLRTAGTLAILPGTGLAKDYREANPTIRWQALLDGIERALEAPKPGAESGATKIARRALDGALDGKRLGMRDLEAWRFGQRCAGMCRAFAGGLRYFAIRANLYGQLVTAEGQHEFAAVTSHPRFRDVELVHPDLAAVIRAGATESHLSTQWRPPVFLEDGRHWTEIPPGDRKAYARAHGWEPWTGEDPGVFTPADLLALQDQMRKAYHGVSLASCPDSEVGNRVLAFALATALCSFWAEERITAGQSTGFLPWVWFYGGAGTGKGTAAKLVALLVSGSMKTYGGQRFDGEEDGWLTESVLHLPVCFRDELDQFLAAGTLEDLKTFIGGESLQLRKKFQAGMTIPPKPVVFTSNKLKVNDNDEPTKERIILVELHENPFIGTRARRNQEFEALYQWVEAGGSKVFQRVGIHLYKLFRRIPIGKARWTRSSVFDSALDFIAPHLGVSAQTILAASEESKALSIRAGSGWYQALEEFAQDGASDTFQTSGAGAFRLSTQDESQRKKLRRWMESLERAIASGPLVINGFKITLNPFGGAKSTTTQIVFSRVEANHAAS